MSAGGPQNNSILERSHGQIHEHRIRIPVQTFRSCSFGRGDRCPPPDNVLIVLLSFLGSFPVNTCSLLFKRWMQFCIMLLPDFHPEHPEDPQGPVKDPGRPAFVPASHPAIHCFLR